MDREGGGEKKLKGGTERVRENMREKRRGSGGEREISFNLVEKKERFRQMRRTK